MPLSIYALAACPALVSSAIACLISEPQDTVKTESKSIPIYPLHYHNLTEIFYKTLQSKTCLLNVDGQI